jgi:transcription elongation factor GreA
MATCRRTPSTKRRRKASFIEGRFRTEDKFASAQIVDPARRCRRPLRVWRTVDLEVGGETVTYQIVGEDEADIKSGKISISSRRSHARDRRSIGDVAKSRRVASSSTRYWT